MTLPSVPFGREFYSKVWLWHFVFKYLFRFWTDGVSHQGQAYAYADQSAAVQVVGLVLRWCEYIPCKFVPKEDTVFHILYWKEATCHAFYEQSTLNSCKQAMLILHRLLQVPESICVLICGACMSLSFSLDGLDSRHMQTCLKKIVQKTFRFWYLQTFSVFWPSSLYLQLKSLENLCLIVHSERCMLFVFNTPRWATVWSLSR